MALSIKDPETDRLTRQVADLTGETLTVAIAVSLRERLQRLERTSRAEAQFNKIRRITGRFKAEITEPIHSLDHGELFYDEDGLPK